MLESIPMQLLTASDEKSADLYIMGDIVRNMTFLGFSLNDETDTSYSDVVSALNDLPASVDEIFVHINSYGGEVAEGVAIYNALLAHPARVTTICEGFACSIASVIFMAGDERIMNDASLLMLHNASMGAHGDSRALRHAADTLDTVTELSRKAYLAHATEELTEERLVEVMDDETWIDAQTALSWGLATTVRGVTEDDDNPTQGARLAIMRQLAGTLCEPAAATYTMPAFDEGVLRMCVTQAIREYFDDNGASPSAGDDGATSQQNHHQEDEPAARAAQLFAALANG